MGLGLQNPSGLCPLPTLAAPRAAPVPPPAPARYAQPVQVYWRRSALPPAPEAPGATQVTSSYLLVQLRNK